MAVARAVSRDLEFSVPTVTPKVYMTKGPSGWVETFKRTVLDKELTAFLAPLPVDTLVELFVAKRELSEDKEPTSWFTIVGHISRTKGINPIDVPHTVGIAFWAHVVLATVYQGLN